MMRPARRWTATLALAGCLLAVGPALGGDANLLYGRKAISENQISDLQVDDQTETGLALTLDVGLPVQLALDILRSEERSQLAVEGTYPTVLVTEVATLELNAGVRKSWGRRARPFVGAGLAWISLEAQQIAWEEIVPGNPQPLVLLDDDDGGLGFWAEFGFLYRVGRGLNLGVDARFSKSDATLRPEGFPGTVTIDSGGLHGLLLLGYHW